MAVTSAELTIVRDAAVDAGCWALAAMDNTDKATPVINTRMLLPPNVFLVLTSGRCRSCRAVAISDRDT